MAISIKELLLSTPSTKEDTFLEQITTIGSHLSKNTQQLSFTISVNDKIGTNLKLGQQIRHLMHLVENK